ncbi:uncharacterized protein CLUP02_08855 [Colletotrichum lupini]|uniref:Uncharacterized protein n=1 Tax=Colletotrichum lupini TaxID=145971 RepID=A0A9Q8WI12_9PEZI|nr:uncharacterized protein CLUP02_08855 [Colletotrichum lupini]UQC83360.1 hypothetical protein CLUP02_08855 [Colletotrichum lupini]
MPYLSLPWYILRPAAGGRTSRCSSSQTLTGPKQNNDLPRLFWSVFLRRFGRRECGPTQGVLRCLGRTGAWDDPAPSESSYKLTSGKARIDSSATGYPAFVSRGIKSRNPRRNGIFMHVEEGHFQVCVTFLLRALHNKYVPIFFSFFVPSNLHLHLHLRGMYTCTSPASPYFFDPSSSRRSSPPPFHPSDVERALPVVASQSHVNYRSSVEMHALASTIPTRLSPQHVSASANSAKCLHLGSRFTDSPGMASSNPCLREWVPLLGRAVKQNDGFFKVARQGTSRKVCILYPQPITIRPVPIACRCSASPVMPGVFRVREFRSGPSYDRHHLQYGMGPSRASCLESCRSLTHHARISDKTIRKHSYKHMFQDLSGGRHIHSEGLLSDTSNKRLDTTSHLSRERWLGCQSMIGPKASVTHPGQLNIAGGALSTITDLKMEGKLTDLHRPYH